MYTPCRRWRLPARASGPRWQADAPGRDFQRHRHRAGGEVAPDCRSGDFIGTNRMFGRATASQTASASKQSFFLTLAYVFLSRLTNYAAIIWTVCPNVVSSAAE